MAIKLAIVIPAYKSAFLKEAVNSVLNQTNQQFYLYIGVDGSLVDTIKVLKPYKDRENLTIHVFDENLGGKDLVAQWERCIALSKNEEYIWLFPDDDVMSPDCVEGFYQFINSTTERPWLLRFNNFRIDDNGNPITKLKALPVKESGDDYLVQRMLYRRISSLAEHIFSREAYDNYGIVNLPAAWDSDTLTWYKYGNIMPIYTILNGEVLIRHGKHNISSVNEYFKKEKLKAIYDFYFFLVQDNFFVRNKTSFDSFGGVYNYLKKSIFFQYGFLNYKFNFIELIKYTEKNRKLFQDGHLQNLLRLLFYNYSLIKKIINRFKQ